MLTCKLLIEYDGTNLHGWQIQPNLDTVQGKIEDALETILKARTAVVGSGRTDAGVHARGQVAHFCLESAVDLRKLQASLNGLLPRAVRILNAKAVHDSFHARYDANARTYRYYVTTRPRALDAHTRWFVRPEPDFERMNEAARALHGRHEFSAFCRVQSETVNRVCDVATAEWLREDRGGDWLFEIVADRFLHGMVRTVVGTLLEIGLGKRTVENLAKTLASGDRRRAGQAAPARGLVLEHVGYPEAS